MLKKLIEIDDFFELYNSDSFVYLLAVLVILYLGKKIYELSVPYNLNEQLTTVDNKACALSFTGYMVGIGIIVWGVFSEEQTKGLLGDITDTVIWSVVGISLLLIARYINDKLILRGFCNTKELIIDKNIGTGAAECGSFIGSAFIIMASISGESNSLIESIFGTLLFFVAGQIGFILFAKIFQATVRFDLHVEIEKDNASAGVGFGMTLVAMGILLSNPVLKSDSLLVFCLWFFISTALLVVFRYLMDKLILPGKLLDEEIKFDRNWGAALLNGSMAIVIAAIVNIAY